MELTKYSPSVLECIFCSILKGESPSSIIYETKSILVFLSLDGGYPLVVTKEHIENLFDPKLTNEVVGEMGIVERDMARLVRDTMRVSAVTRVTTNGSGSGQEIMHLHSHIMPRTQGDNLVKFKRGELFGRKQLDALANRYRRHLPR